MKAEDIKFEIQKSLDNVPESVLQEVLTFLKQVEGKSADEVNLVINLRDILSEDKELLERLAK
jgi:hypothetical protein